MQFISPVYLAFLTLLFLLFRLCPALKRKFVLLVGSMIFIAWYQPYAFLLVCSFSLLTYWSAHFISKRNTPAKVVCYLVVGLQIFSLVLLKYIESDTGGLRFLFKEAGFRTDSFLFAVGFSFYTLQHIGYLIDIYKGRAQAERSFIDFLLYSAFFAKFNSGPLEKANALLSQMEKPEADEADLATGIQRILLGFFKKMLLADRLAPIVGQVFGDQDQLGSVVTAAGICLFTIQLYFDFSAYSDIALGSARIFGIRLMENFNFPFSATSVSEFWRRWHISLINWFTGYIYYPLVFRFRKYGKAAVIAGIACTFLLSGIWHGIGKTFLVWSLLHATYLSYEALTKNTRVGWSARRNPFLYRYASMILTFALVCFSNLFFRADNLGQASVLLHELAKTPFAHEGFWEGFIAVLAGGGYQEALFNFWITLVLVASFLVFEKGIVRRFATGLINYRQLIFLLILIFVFGIFKKADYFIYLQF
jgi:alginate O-acetyltransferase complex protein AlgI